MGQLRKTLAVAKKDIRIYYGKGPVVIFGILMPIFFFLAFWMGRDVPSLTLAVGLLAMVLWFTSTSISPTVTPWETRTRTLERLVSSPISRLGIVAGDVLASMVLGLVLTVIPVTIAILFLELPLVHPEVLLAGVILASFCFSSVGVLMAAYPTDSPADVMLLSTLVKFPVLFISGIFIPLAELPPVGQAVAHLSPLTYLTDLANYSFGGQGDAVIDLLALCLFTVVFVVLAWLAHAWTLPRRL